MCNLVMANPASASIFHKNGVRTPSNVKNTGQIKFVFKNVA